MYQSAYNLPESHRGNIIDEILAQGQKLRNALVETIVSNDPFYNSDPISTTRTNIELPNSELSRKDSSSLSDDERLALSRLQLMSTGDIRKTTDKILSAYSQPCSCEICKLYNLSGVWSDDGVKENRETKPVRENEVVRLIEERYCKRNDLYFRYVDSLQVNVISLSLSESGNRRVAACEGDVRFKMPVSIRHTYFVEYRIPESLTGSGLRTFGASDKNFVRFCSKKLQKDATNFKQISVHDIQNFNGGSLMDTEITFKVSCRSLKQKKATIIGEAKFDFNSFKTAKHLTCNQDLVIKTDDHSPVVMGILKVSLKLGCGKMYFGKEFIDAASIKMENCIQPVFSDSSSLCTEKSRHNNTSVALDIPQTKRSEISSKQNSVPETARSKANSVLPKVQSIAVNTSSRTAEKYTQSQCDNLDSLPANSIQNNLIVDSDKQILFGFLYISEAEYFEEYFNTCLSCQPFCLNESIASRSVFNTQKPTFNFRQLIPLIYDEQLLYKLRENFITIEFFKIEDSKKEPFGLAKISLHQFYLAYRNNVIVKYLLQNKLPVIGCDWWEPISEIDSTDTIGQVQVLLALGSEEQIKQLEKERGFKENVVVAVKTQRSIKSPKQPKTAQHPHNVTFQKQPPTAAKKPLITPSPRKTPRRTVETGTQSEMSFQKTCSTNTDDQPLPTPVPQPAPPVTPELASKNTTFHMNRTTDLLDSLAKALQIPELSCNQTEMDKAIKLPETFKANVIVEKATHVLGRKKKMRMNKEQQNSGRCPGVYVSFEGAEGIKMTKIVNSLKPKWDYRADVDLPVDLLTNSQKRLIFKVWKKIKGSEPCLESDEVLGFAALDLTVLLAGLPMISGWFNIVDFSNRCSGQIKIQLSPLVDIFKYKKRQKLHPKPAASPKPLEDAASKPDDCSESLSRALKRKFVELDEITQRLRLRLSDVTRDATEEISDDVADQFERDINTICVEDDFDMINLEIENEKFNGEFMHGASGGSGLLQMDPLEQNEQCFGNNSPRKEIHELDRKVIEGKQRIDTLLEKLSLQSNTMHSNRYISGCSTNEEQREFTETEILKDLGIEPRTSFEPEKLLNSAMFKDMYKVVMDEEARCSTTSSGSESSLLTSLLSGRKAPEGAGNGSEGDK